MSPTLQSNDKNIIQSRAYKKQVVDRSWPLSGQTAVVTEGPEGAVLLWQLPWQEQEQAQIILVRVRRHPHRFTQNASLLIADPCRETIPMWKPFQSVRYLGRRGRILTAYLPDQSSVSRIIPSLADTGQIMDIIFTCASIQSRHPAHNIPD